MTTTVCRACGGVNSPLRWACPCCVRATSERLGEIRDHAVAITLARAGLGPVDGLTGAGGYEFRPPATHGLLAALDDCSLRDGDPTVVLLAILGTLNEVARYVRHHRGEPGAWRCTIASEAGYLRGNAEWCAHQIWGHEFVDVIRGLHTRTALRVAEGSAARREAS